MKVIIKTSALLALCVSMSVEAAEKHDLNVVCSKTVAFVLPVKAAVYQGMLDQLTTTTISLNRQAIIQSLTTQLKKEGIAPANGMTIEKIAEQFYIKSVIPALQPRVEAFNDRVNKEVKKDRVSVGVNVTDLGISKSMEAWSKDISEILIEGFYSYKKDAFEKGGRWHWYDQDMILGTTGFSRTIDGAIDEDIKFDLTPYGKDHFFTLNFSATGLVKFEQKYGCNRIGPATYDGPPATQVRVHPYVELKLSKNISGNSYFTIKGNPEQQVDKKILHKAEHTVKMQAIPPK